jgi:hypothetical protein
MNRMYYRLTIEDHPNGERLEYQIGRDRDNLEMSRAIQINATTPTYMAEWVEEVFSEVRLYDLTPV